MARGVRRENARGVRKRMCRRGEAVRLQGWELRCLGLTKITHIERTLTCTWYSNDVYLLYVNPICLQIKSLGKGMTALQ